MKLTREEAIRLHREMWDYIAKKEAELSIDIDINTRATMKREFLKIKSITPDYILNDCFLCEYADSHSAIWHSCSKCPLEWGVMANIIVSLEILKDLLIGGHHQLL